MAANDYQHGDAICSEEKQMNKAVCLKCGNEISNEFGVTLSFWANAGANGQLPKKPYFFGNCKLRMQYACPKTSKKSDY